MVLNGLIAPGPAAIHSSDAIDPSVAGLQRVANRPIVCHALQRLRDAGVRDAALVVPAEASAEIQARAAAEGPTDLVGRCFAYDDDASAPQALSAAIAFLGDAPCIVHPPNGLLAAPLTPFVELLGADGPDLVALVRGETGEVDSVGIAVRRLLRMGDHSPRGGATPGLSGICVFGKGGLRLAQEVNWRPGCESDLVIVAERLVNAGGALRIGDVEEWRTYTGNTLELLEINRIALDALGPQLEPVQGDNNRIEGHVTVHPSATVQSSVIIGPAIIGPRALVSESYIGPYTSIGANAHIEGAEVERSIVLAGARIMHVGGRLVASVVGRDARILRDFSLPRAIRLNVGDGGEVVLC